MNVHVFTSVSVKVGEERTWLFARSVDFEVSRSRDTQILIKNVTEKKKTVGIDTFIIAFNLVDVDLFSVSLWRTSVLMATLCSRFLFRLYESVLPNNTSRCRAIPVVRSATKSKELTFKGLADLCWRRSRRPRRKSDAPFRASTKFEGLDFKAAVFVCLWWHGQA